MNIVPLNAPRLVGDLMTSPAPTIPKDLPIAAAAYPSEDDAAQASPPSGALDAAAAGE